VHGDTGTYTGADFNSIGGTTGTATEKFVVSGSTYMLLGNSYTGTAVSSGGTGGILFSSGGSTGALVTLLGSSSDLSSGTLGTLATSSTASPGWQYGSLGISGTKASNVRQGVHCGPNGTINGTYLRPPGGSMLEERKKLRPGKPERGRA